ncbi:unnamed protein product [Macrosiphum euphorbiae]|uniref:Uncharacterized protein n=1 Tax=Macrosiphum euphorbiae TaxID=13131 RepID=A0AAV0WBG1_9HEMI|nr:unnamed protein product [Macrosiphum euphorbiae]
MQVTKWAAQQLVVTLNRKYYYPRRRLGTRLAPMRRGRYSMSSTEDTRKVTSNSRTGTTIFTSPILRAMFNGDGHRTKHVHTKHKTNGAVAKVAADKYTWYNVPRVIDGGSLT